MIFDQGFWMKKVRGRIRPKIGPLAAISLALLGGCLATPYQPDGIGGGYSESRIDAATMMVDFRANSRTPHRLVESYLLYRCAQVTRDSGFAYFVPLDSEGRANAFGRWAPSLNPSFNDLDGGPSSYFPPGAISYASDGAARVSIRMFRDPGKASDPVAYRAADVIAALAKVANGESETAGENGPPPSSRIYSGRFIDYLAGE